MIKQEDIFVKGQTSSLAWMDELEEVKGRIRELEYLLADIEEAPEEYEDVDKGAYEAELQDWKDGRKNCWKRMSDSPRSAWMKCVTITGQVDERREKHVYTRGAFN